MVVEKSRLVEAHQKRFSHSGPVRVFRAPGRVNLIGEHTDYSEGYVLPIALEMATYIAVAPNANRELRAYSENLDDQLSWPANWLSLQPQKNWGDYVAGIARKLAEAGYPPNAADLYIFSTLPTGSGLSSSAALEVSAELALLSTRDGAQPLPLEQVHIARRSENDFVGLPCGIMDQYISRMAREGAALLIDCRTLENESVQLPSNVIIYVVNTMVKHELGGSAYRDRVAECAEAVAAIQQKHPEVKMLRDALLSYVDEATMSDVARKRARHVVSENDRVHAFMEASRNGDLKRMGELFVASHRSLQHDFEVSCEELDFLVDTTTTLDGVYGSRMTGGGFGGCTVNLVAPEAAAQFEEKVREAYKQRYALDPAIFACLPSAGAGEL